MPGMFFRHSVYFTATRVRIDKIFNNSFIANFPQNVPENKF